MDIRRSLTSCGTDPRYPDWSYNCHGYDQAARALSFFGFTPVRKIKASFTVRVPRSNIPGGNSMMSRSVVKPVSKPRHVQLVSQACQTPLSAYKLPSGHFMYRYPSRLSGSYSPSQVKRQRSRLVLHCLLKDLRNDTKEFFVQSPELEFLYSLPMYTNLESAQRSKPTLSAHKLTHMFHF